MIIFLHFLIKSYGLNINKSIKYYALNIIVVLSIILSLELWSILIDLSSSFPSHSGYCFGEIYLRILSFILLESSMFFFYVIRMSSTFNGSALALSKKFVYSIFISISSVCFLLMILLAIFINPSYHLVNTSFNSSIPNGHQCIIAVNQNNNFPLKIILVISQIITFSMNIFFGWFFYYKLAQVSFL